MGQNIVEKILSKHLIKGKISRDSFIEISINHTLLQDALGTMTCLQFEEMGLTEVNTDLSIIYVDHNTLQTGFENADDHIYLKSFAEKFGLYFSKPGNGICHQVHLERFGYPGGTMIGTDSHTPTCGGVGMLAIGAGGLEVAVTMSTGSYHMRMPEVWNIELSGRLSNGATAKDIILRLLGQLTVRGGIGKIFEFSGEGIKNLSVYDRATITNMGAELGATTSIFPSDEKTRNFLAAQGREDYYKELKADLDAKYDGKIVVNLDELEPLVALPHSPDKVIKVSEIGYVKVDQVCIGSCTNSSYADLMVVAKVLDGKSVHKDVSLVISPGSKQVLNTLAANGALSSIISSGARILESACGPCIGMGQAPNSNGVSVRTFNRNFEKRSGTNDAQVYLVSPETAVSTSLTGFIKALDLDMSTYKSKLPDRFIINDNMIIKPIDSPNQNIELRKGRNIKPIRVFDKMEDKLHGKVLIKLGNNVTTDHIVPGGAEAMSNRSNIPKLAEFCLVRCDENFPNKAKTHGGGFIVGGDNYGQGSSREHAALVPVYLGIRVILAKSYARIHRQNLINVGIIPLVFQDPSNYDELNELDLLELPSVKLDIINGRPIRIMNTKTNLEFYALCDLNEREREILINGGMINYIKTLTQIIK